MTRTIAVVCLVVVMVAGAAFAQEGERKSPEEVVQAAFDSQNQFDWDTYTSYMHTEALQQYKDIIWPTVEQIFGDSTLSIARAQMLLGVGADANGNLPDYPPADFFSNSLLQITESVPQFKQQLGSGQTTVLGSVKEGDDLVHVVVRITFVQMGTSISQVKVSTVKLDNGKWRLLLSPEMMGLANGVVQLLNQP